MAKMKKYMVVHKTPDLDCQTLQGNWRKLADTEAATWVRTYYNEPQGVRYCVWLAPDEAELKHIFKEMNIGWESIMPVEEVSPDLWGERWQQHLAQDRQADTLGN